MEEVKMCSCCKETKAVEEFHWKNQSIGIRQYQCKSCHKKVNASHYENNKSDYKQRSMSQRLKARDWLQEFKKTLHCEQCGESHPATLDFHHLDPNSKDGAVSSLTSNGSVQIMKKEIAKCIVLCSNCHRKLHYEERK